MTHDGSTQARPLADDPARGMPRLPLWAASLTIAATHWAQFTQNAEEP